MFCPHCGEKLNEPVERFCGCCHKDITTIAVALLDAQAKLSDDLTEAALFQKHQLESQAFETVKGVDDLVPGDLIEFFRTGYQHWAVYVGDGDIVHLVALARGNLEVSSTISGVPTAGKVRKDKMTCVINRNEWRKNNTAHPNYDNQLNPRPNEAIVEEALLWEGKDVQYNVSTWNCEHFATKCRYGKALSLQVLKFPGSIVRSFASSCQRFSLPGPDGADE